MILYPRQHFTIIKVVTTDIPSSINGFCSLHFSEECNWFHLGNGLERNAQLHSEFHEINTRNYKQNLKQGDSRLSEENSFPLRMLVMAVTTNYAYFYWSFQPEFTNFWTFLILYYFCFIAASASQRDSSSSKDNNPYGSKQNALDLDAFKVGPYFDKAASKNVTALLGKTAYLNCRVKNLGNKTVS